MKKVRNAREIALRILMEVENGAYADRALGLALSEVDLDSRDRRLVTELVNGGLRMRGHIDWILNLFARGGIERFAPQVRNCLRLGVYQIIFLDKIPDAVAVNETVVLAKRFGHQGVADFVNAVLRKVVGRGFPYPSLASDPISHISVLYSHPQWLVRRWVNRSGVEETIELCQANNRVPDIVLRVNLLQVSLQEAMAVLAEGGLEPRQGQYLPGYIHVDQAGELLRHPTFEKGWFVAQDESAGLATLLLDPQPGERVLDLCSAPGGKTVHTAQLMRNQGRIVAVDINGERLGLVDENCRRLGVEIVETVQADGTQLSAEPFDRILVDAPCSGTGVLARRADARWRKTEKQIRELTEVQKRLLDHAVQLLKKDGILVYSTCSIEEEENEDVMGAVLEQHSELVVEDAAPFVPKELVGPDRSVRTLPHRHGVDGSFVVRMRKTAQASPS